MAHTLGHTVLGQTDAALEIAREHELVHVRQYERWGPFMGPAYLGCSLVLWLTAPHERTATIRSSGRRARKAENRLQYTALRSFRPDHASPEFLIRPVTTCEG